MVQSMTEATLEGITITIAYLEKQDNCDPKILEILRENRTVILRRLQLIE